MSRNRAYANLKADVLGVSAKTPADFEVKLLDLAKLVRTAQECQQQSDTLRGLQEQRIVSALQTVQEQLQQLQQVIFVDSPSASRTSGSPLPATQIAQDGAPRAARALTLALGATSTTSAGGGSNSNHNSAGSKNCGEKAAGGDAGAGPGRRLLLARSSEVQALEARVQALESELRGVRREADKAEETREQLEMLILERLIALECRTNAEGTPTHSISPGGPQTEPRQQCTQPWQQQQQQQHEYKQRQQQQQQTYQQQAQPPQYPSLEDKQHKHQGHQPSPASTRGTQTGRARPSGEVAPTYHLPSLGGGISAEEQDPEPEDENDPRVLRRRIDALTALLESSVLRVERTGGRQGGVGDANHALPYASPSEAEDGRLRTAPAASARAPAPVASGQCAAAELGRQGEGSARALAQEHEARMCVVTDIRRSGEGGREVNGPRTGLSPCGVNWTETEVLCDSGGGGEAWGGGPGRGPQWTSQQLLQDSTDRLPRSPLAAPASPRSLEPSTSGLSRLHQSSVHLLQDLSLAQQALSTCVDRLEALCPRLGKVLQELDTSCCGICPSATSITPTFHTTIISSSREDQQAHVAAAGDSGGAAAAVDVDQANRPFREGRRGVVRAQEPHIVEAYGLAREASGLLTGLRDALMQVVAQGRESLLSAQDWKPSDTAGPPANMTSQSTVLQQRDQQPAAQTTATNYQTTNRHLASPARPPLASSDRHHSPVLQPAGAPTTQPTTTTGPLPTANVHRPLPQGPSSQPTAATPQDTTMISASSTPTPPAAPACFTHIPLTPSAPNAAASGLASTMTASDSAPVSIISLAQLALPQPIPPAVMMGPGVASPSPLSQKAATGPNIPTPSASLSNQAPVVTSSPTAQPVPPIPVPPLPAPSLPLPSLPAQPLPPGFPEWLFKAAAALASTAGPSQDPGINNALGALLRTAISEQQPYSSQDVGKPSQAIQQSSSSALYTQQPVVPTSALIHNIAAQHNTTMVFTARDKPQADYVASLPVQRNEEPPTSARSQQLPPAHCLAADPSSSPVTFPMTAHNHRPSVPFLSAAVGSLSPPLAQTVSYPITLDVASVPAAGPQQAIKAARGAPTASVPPRRHTTGSVEEAPPTAAPMHPIRVVSRPRPAGVTCRGGGASTEPVPLLLDEVLLSSPPLLSYDSQRSPVGTARHMLWQHQQGGSPLPEAASRQGRSYMGKGGCKLSPIQSSPVGARYGQRDEGYGYDYHADDDSRWGWLSDDADGGGGCGGISSGAGGGASARLSRRCTSPAAAMVPSRSGKQTSAKRYSSNAAAVVDAATYHAAGHHAQPRRQSTGGGASSKVTTEAPPRGSGTPGPPVHLGGPRHASSSAAQGPAGGRGVYPSLGTPARQANKLAVAKQDRHVYPPPVPGRRHTVSAAPVTPAEAGASRPCSRPRGRTSVAHRANIETFGGMPSSPYAGGLNTITLLGQAALGLFYSSSSSESPRRRPRRAAAAKKGPALAAGKNTSREHLVSDLDPGIKKLPGRRLRKSAL